MADKTISDEIKVDLKTLADRYSREDLPTRERQIRQWRKLKYYWDGFQRIYWSEVAHDWRVWDSENSGSGSDQSAYYDKPVNVYRAYLESIIAALSVNVPAIMCYPDDADNSSDMETARAGNEICKLIYRHNDAPLLWLNALYVLCTEGLVFAYNYTKEDESYGTYKKDVYKNEEIEVDYRVCPVCNARLQDKEISDLSKDKYDPGEEDVIGQDVLSQTDICPECDLMITPSILKEKMIISKLVEQKNVPKARQCIEVYGGLYCKVSSYAKTQKGTPYLIFSRETNVANAIERYGTLDGKIKTGDDSNSNTIDNYEKWGRMPVQVLGDDSDNIVTIKTVWLRPAAFSVLHEDRAKELKKEFPNGCKVTFVNDYFAEACNEDLDDHWTLTYNPTSDYLYHEPLGQLLVSIQDITNDLINLTLQTIEHGIGQTFADPQVLNFAQYGDTEVNPGMIFPAKAVSGKNLSDGFFQFKTATLSSEVMPFAEKVQQLGQTASGALPSLFGGAQPNSSKTAAQYSMSRNQALQRLQNNWKMMTYWWKNVFSKVIPAYIKDVVEDEKFVERDSSGNFINVFVRASQLNGKIGSIELEGSEQLPVTWAQQKDVIMQLLQAGHEDVLRALFSPENIPLVVQAVGLTDFSVPGEDDRQKQYEEIKILVETEPITLPPQMGQENMEMGMEPQEPLQVPSVEIDRDVDNHDIEADICRRWLVSSAGRLAKIENPAGYMNVLLHMKQHIEVLVMAEQAAQAQQAAQTKPGQNNNKPAANKVKDGKQPIAS